MTQYLPDPDLLRQARLARDPSWDGQIWVAVASTGIFCRLSCPALPALERNCSFHASPASCFAAGFRPCRRCDPLGAAIADEAALARALPDLTGRPVSAGADMWASLIETPLGGMIAVCDSAIRLLEFVSRPILRREMRALAVWGTVGIGHTPLAARLEAALHRYFAGESGAFDLPLAPLGTPFRQAVWQELQRIPVGERISYSTVAARLGRPDAVRAVAAANGANPIAILIPCHRVVGADGSLTGYGGGLWRKERLLALEAQAMPGESLDAGRISA
ncbi:MAG: methylated-DNA--[protein]-cysteine S-methyltransferase [Gemmobacter sp.]|jgi:O-6-methylguanine DNA methyltransferase|nr:methylated-DNA--[protein]-cysteine S-methyltransferase [Gemmobacter sp.]